MLFNIEWCRRRAKIAIVHCGMANHARFLRPGTFLRDEGIGESVLRPCDDFESFHHAVMEGHFFEAGLDATGGDGRGIRGDHQTDGP